MYICIHLSEKNMYRVIAIIYFYLYVAKLYLFIFFFFQPNKRLPEEPSSSLKSKSHSLYTRSVPSKIKLKVKDGVAVDPDSGLEDKAQVYQEGKDKYTVVLGLTDIQRQKNSFYKIQLLKADKGNKFWVFRSWGRIGTTIGGNLVDSFSTLGEAKQRFHEIYEEKSGNEWENRKHFVKVPGRMYPIDIEYVEDDSALQVDNQVPSKLAEPVQKLIKMIFDINAMKQVMLEFELDTEKMPLGTMISFFLLETVFHFLIISGKLSKSQIQSAFSVLAELQDLITKKDDGSRFIDASNRFYTLIPHAFGIDDPPIIKSEEMVKVSGNI